VNISQMVKGWFIGNFEPSVYRTCLFEVGYKQHKAGENYGAHYQVKAIEYNLLVRGVLEINGERFTDGDIFTIAPGYVVKPIFVSDCEVVVVKVPSLPFDKVEVADDDDYPTERNWATI